MRQNLICTVGTSLKGNVQKNAASASAMAWQAGRWKDVARELLRLDPSNRDCGAEINSINSIVAGKGLSSRLYLFLLVSDTPDGRNIGEVLRHYFEEKNCPIGFGKVFVEILEGLRDDDIHAFKARGLKNLVKTISRIVRDYSSETVAINATGGYKAQISFAGMIGQALDLPVYYLFERFSDVIVLPPQPVSLNLGLWLEQYDIFERLEDAETLSDGELQAHSPPPSILELLEDVEIDGRKYWGLTAVGQLFHERCRYYFQKHDKTVSSCDKDETPPDKKAIKLSGNHHGNDILLSVAKKLVHSPYVREILNSIDYQPHRAKTIKKVYDDGRIDFVLTHTDAGYGLCVQSTGNDKAETQAIALHLEKKYFS
jgi:putative CRISPR-associated protein (TIGR02619 family)